MRLSLVPLLLALALLLPPAASAQPPAEKQDAYTEFTTRNKETAREKLAQVRELTDFLLASGVGYHDWKWQDWIVNIDEKVVMGKPTCRGSATVPGLCVILKPSYDFPSDDEAFLFGLVQGYVSIAGGGLQAQPKVDGNVFTARVMDGEPRCAAATSIGLWSPELRANAVFPQDVRINGDKLYYVLQSEFAKYPPELFQEFLNRFEALAKP